MMLLQAWANKPTWEYHISQGLGKLEQTYGTSRRLREVEVGETIMTARNKDGNLWLAGPLVRYGPTEVKTGYYMPRDDMRTTVYIVKSKPGAGVHMQLVRVHKKILKALRYISATDGRVYPIALDGYGDLTSMSVAHPLWLTDASAQKLMDVWNNR